MSIRSVADVLTAGGCIYVGPKYERLTLESLRAKHEAAAKTGGVPEELVPLMLAASALYLHWAQHTMVLFDFLPVEPSPDLSMPSLMARTP